MDLLVFSYFFCAVLLTLYGINCHLMIRLFKKNYRRRIAQDRRLLRAFYGDRPPVRQPQALAEALPPVTTQLPVFNEYNVAERLIDAAAAMIYPEGRHEIQVLDDSTDTTQALIAGKVADLQQQGIRIRHIRRTDRRGFKAGALRNGLELADGEFVAIFDADFVPPADFLLRAVPFFLMGENIGLVQARWGHLNRNQSLITRLQSIGIDGHFMIEQSARNTSGLCMNFNGTAGIFRRQAILEAGNWQDDTLTEDMDLSYRMQLAGWRCHYLIDLVAPAEIPADILAFKNQQFRWAKGSIQTALKLLPRILRANFSSFAKLQACLHLTHYLIHPLMLYLAIMALPVLLSGQPRLPTLFFPAFGVLLVIGCSGPSRLYLLAEGYLRRPLFKTLGLMPLMICFGCGLALNNTRAVIEALLGVGNHFVRTPKKGDLPRKAYPVQRSRWFILEIAVGLWCMAGTAVYFAADLYLVGHFLLLYAAGYLYVGILSWQHGIKHP